MLATQGRPVDEALPIVAQALFILATRDTGYRSLAVAVAELIDNALQARASRVDVCVLENRHFSERETSLAVLDNGIGMSPRQLQTALQFGGSDRFDDRSGPGRFGMGLPNSSVSQTRRLEVYSWTSGQRPYYTFLDVDQIASGRLSGIPIPVQRELPAWSRSHGQTEHGTLVVWANCDRLERRKASTVAQRLENPLGRIYRQALWDGLELSINGNAVAPVDPLLCSTVDGTGGATEYGDPLTYEVEAVPGLGQCSLVTVRFTELPVEAWQGLSPDEKRLRGIVGGAGTSVLRAGREIDFGWYFMGSKRRENYDDWWRCEVRFEPLLDELFGVTHSKQGITPTASLRGILSNDIEAVARRLNARVRRKFEQIRRDTPTIAARAATASDRFLPPIASEPRFEPRMAPSRAPHDGSFRYAIESRALAVPDFFVTERVAEELRIILNTNHPFFDRTFGCEGLRPEHRRLIECILLSAARASAAVPVESESWTKFCREWSDALAVFLDASR